MDNNSSQPTVNYEDVLNKDILSLMQADNLPDDEKQKLYEKMLGTIQNRVIARITDKLTDEEVEELKKLLDEGDQDKIQSFMKAHDIDWPKMMLEETLIYKTELASLSNNLEK